MKKREGMEVCSEDMLTLCLGVGTWGPVACIAWWSLLPPWMGTELRFATSSLNSSCLDRLEESTCGQLMALEEAP